MQLPKKFSVKYIVLAAVGIIATAFLYTAASRRADKYFEGTVDPND